jgi:putative membrane protein
MMWGYDERWDRMHDSDGPGWLMVLLMLVLVIAAVVAVVALVRGTVPLRPAQRDAGGGRPDPRAILQERFARGEIDEQDFRTRMRALDESSGG